MSQPPIFCAEVCNAANTVTKKNLITIVHPFHPASGHSGSYAGERVNKYGTKILIEIDSHLWSVPREWTDLVSPEPIEVIGKKQAVFSFDDLLELQKLVEHLIRKDTSE